MNAEELKNTLKQGVLDGASQEYKNRVHALALHLNADRWLHEVAQQIEDGVYTVATDEMADELVAEYITECLWAFNPHFVAKHCPDGIEEEHIKAMWGEGCGENCNEAFVALVKAGNGMEKLIAEAKQLDGRGHFLSSYDGHEHEVTYNGTEYYIYKN